MRKTTKILGISAYYHDSAACLVIEGKIKAAAQEERFTRKKHDLSFPANAIRYCLDEGETTISGIDKVVFYEKPFVKFERLLETYLGFAPHGFRSFIAAMPVWLKEKLFLKHTLQKELKKHFGKEQPPTLFAEHHQSHAALNTVPLYLPLPNGHPLPAGYDEIAFALAPTVDRYLPKEPEGLLLTPLDYKYRPKIPEDVLTVDHKIILVKDKGIYLFNTPELITANGWKATDVQIVSLRDIIKLPLRDIINTVDPSKYGPAIFQ